MGLLRRERRTGPPRRGRCVRGLRRQRGGGTGVAAESRGRGGGRIGKQSWIDPPIGVQDRIASTKARRRSDRGRPFNPSLVAAVTRDATPPAPAPAELRDRAPSPAPRRCAAPGGL